jgi:heme A synthase
MGDWYPLFRDLHFWISRLALAAGLVMLGLSIYIGLIRHGDSTPWFRRGVYAMVAVMAIEALIGLAMLAAGGRPHEDVHLIYGAGAVLALPFFIFVERTATKRPAMGSYIWGFGLMAAIMLRAIMTGAAG